LEWTLVFNLQIIVLFSDSFLPKVKVCWACQRLWKCYVKFVRGGRSPCWAQVQHAALRERELMGIFWIVWCCEGERRPQAIPAFFRWLVWLTLKTMIFLQMNAMYTVQQNINTQDRWGCFGVKGVHNVRVSTTNTFTHDSKLMGLALGKRLTISHKDCCYSFMNIECATAQWMFQFHK